MNTLSLTVLAAMALFGAALLWVIIADRRRQALQQRLKSLVAPTRDQDEPVPSLTLRRRISRARPGVQQLVISVWAQLQAELAAAGNRVGVPYLVVVAFSSGLLLSAFILYFGLLKPALAILLGIAAGPVAAAAFLRYSQARFRGQFLEVFPDALDLICRAVRAGLPINEAMGVAARDIADPVGSELRVVLNEIQIGAEPQDALHRMADRVRVPEFRFYAVAIALQRRTGGGLAETLANLSAVVRARKALYLKTRALSAEMRMSAYILAVLPFVVGAGMYVMNRGLMSVLFTDPRGRFMLGMAFCTLFGGIAVMVVMMKRSLR